MAEPLIAPLTGKPCAAFETRASIIEQVCATKVGISCSHVRAKSIWETLKLVSKTTDFLIKCEKSYAIVRVDQSNLKIQKEFVHDENSYTRDRGGFLSESENKKRQETLMRMDLSYRNYVGVYAEDIKFEEGILEQDEQVAVRGVGRWINIGGNEELNFLREKGINKIFEIKHCPDHSLYISDSLDVLEKVTITKG